MNWTKLLYGTVVAAGLVTTGTLVWFSARPQLHTVDIIEVFQGGQERCLATQFIVSTNGVTIYTNRTLVYGANDPSGLGWVQYSTNGVATTNHYVTVTGTNNISISRTQEMAAGYTYSDLFRVSPVDTLKIYRTASTNSMYIWGGYSNYVVAGITGDAAGFNGSYTFVYRVKTATQFYDEYWLNGTDVAHKLIDYGPRGGHLVTFDYDGWDPSTFSWASAVLCDVYHNVYFFTFADECVRFAKWQNTAYGDAADISVTASGLMPAYLRDAWPVTDDWQWNSISWIAERKYFASEEESIGYGVMSGAALSTKLRAAAQWYVDDTQATAGEFLNFSNALPVLAGSMGNHGLPELSNLWARLAFTNFFDYVDFSDDSINRYFLFSDETGAQPGSMVDVKTPGWMINSTNLGQRYKLAQALRWTRGNATWQRAWTNAPNTYFWQSGAFYATWAEAVAACISNTPTATYIDGPPYVGTVGIQDGGYYAAFAACRASVLVASFTTQIQHSVEFYARAQAYGKGVYTNNTWSDEGFGLTENCFTRFNQVASGTHACVTSSIIGQTNMPAVFCDAPTAEATTSRGYLVTSGDTVAKWGFLYCTNALP